LLRIDRGEHLPLAALLLGGGTLVLGLFVLGAALENRPWALRLELVRLAFNLPLVWWAPLVGLWPASPLAWIGVLSYSLLSLIGLYYCSKPRVIRLAGS